MAKQAAAVLAPISTEGYSWETLHDLVGIALRAKISVLMRGHPGVGKSTLAHRLAQDLGLELIDIRLAQRDPADLAGVYFPDAERKRLELVPPAWALRAREVPCLVFLDEINAAVTRLHQAAAYQIVLERRVGPVEFHKDTRILAAGNLEEDNAIVSSLSSALCNRFAHFILKVNAEDWLRWATNERLHPDILSFISAHKEDALYKNTGDVAFPSPRSWEMASRVYELATEADQKRMVTSCVGSEAAEKFSSYLTIYRKIDAEKIVRKGAAIDFSIAGKSEASFRHAAVYAVGYWIYRTDNLEDAVLPNVVKFLRSKGLDPEYQFIFLRFLHSHDPRFLVRMRAVPEYRQLCTELVNFRTAGLN